MRYRVELSAQAVKDLRGIYRYIAHELRTPDSADGQLLQLEDSICGLAEMRGMLHIMTQSRGVRAGCAGCRWIVMPCFIARIARNASSLSCA